MNVRHIIQLPLHSASGVRLLRLDYLPKRWSYFIRKVYETDPLTCPKCSGEMKIISFIDQPDVIKKILQHLGLWEDSHAPPERSPPGKEITFDPSYSQLI